jgi:hypothetical protein
MQLTRSTGQHSTLRRTAGPYILAPSYRIDSVNFSVINRTEAVVGQRPARRRFGLKVTRSRQSRLRNPFFRSPLGKPTLCELVPATSQIGCEVAHGLYVVYLRSTDLGEP